MKSIIVFALTAMVCLQGSAQEDQIDAFITEAKDYLAQKQYRQAQLSLQDAVHEIDNLIAIQVGETLPAEINGLQAEGDASVNTGMMGMLGGGFQIMKRYANPAKPENTAEVTLLANAPQLATMNMFISNPGMMGEGYKSARLGTRRAIFKSEMQDYYDDNGNSKQIRSTEIQLPFGQTLVTWNLLGFASEQEEIAFASKPPYDEIEEMLGN
jgi:hypothetical protein